MSEKVPSGRSSPNKAEKSRSSSESSIHFDFISNVPSELLTRRKIRPSSWDESDGDESTERERSSEGTQLHSSESQKFKASVAAEINELKKQFFESLQKLKNSNYEPLEIEKKLMEIKSEDRRQCPARVRRRTKSSSSLSPVLETRSQNSTEKSNGVDEASEELKSNTPDFNSKYYLNNFFNELRTKRISSTYPSFVTVTVDEEDSKCENQDGEQIPLSDDLTATDINDNDTNYCKTARKLSQIMEIEENKRDLDKSSEEMSKNTQLFPKSLNSPEKNASPFQSARIIGEKISKNLKKTKKDFRSLSFEELEEDFEEEIPSRGSVSERSSRFFRKKPRDNFSFLSVKSPKFRIKSPKLFEKKTSKSPKKFNPINTQSDKESSSKEDEKENFDSICPKVDSAKKLNSEDSTPRSTDRSDFDRTTRTKSEKSKNYNLDSPKYRINTDRDSVKSLTLEDVNTPDSLKQDAKSESKSVLSEDRSPRKSTRQSSSENNSERKSYRNLQIPLECLSVESLKSSNSKESELNSSKSHKSKSTERSKCKEGKIKKHDFLLDINKPVERHSLVESSRSYKIPISSRVGSPTQEKFKNESERSTIRSRQSSRSSKSGKTSSPKSRKKFFGQSFKQAAPSAESDLPLDDISESQKLSYRSIKLSDTNSFKHSSRRSSDRSSASKDKNAGKTNPKISPRTNDSVSNRSKESLENTIEDPDFQTNPRRESENINDISSNRSSSEISSTRSFRRTQNTTTQQSSPERRVSDLERSTLNTPKNSEFLEERQSTSGKSSRRSEDSTRNTSPTKSIKFSPNARTSELSKFPDIEKSYFDVGHAAISDTILSTSEEDVKETCSSQRLKSESESDRYSEKRLSIINEVSVEDLVVSTDSFENENSSREPSRKSSKREMLSMNRSLKSTARSQKETPKEKADDEEWNELIETFSKNPDTSFVLERTFSNLPYTSEPWNTYTTSDGEGKKNTSARSAENRIEFDSDNETEDREPSKNSYLDYEGNSLEKAIKKDMATLHNFQNLYYFNVNEQEPFRIGECGDVTNWNADKSDTPEKPKAYGDGMILQNTSEVFALLGKKEKEVKTQRQLWTDLRGDFRRSKQKLNKVFPELEDDTNFKQVISVGPKISKSDNCINAKNGDGDYLKMPEASELKSKSEIGTFEGKISTAKNPSKPDLESTEYEKEEIENIEFDCGVPRRSTSMIDLNIQFEKENFEDVQLNSNFNSSASLLFEKTNVISKKEKESTNLNIFLARNQKEEKTAVKSNNWLNFKALEPEKSNKKNKKIKRNRKGITSPKENHQEYLYTAKSRSSVPTLKLRNSSCFQNFYKRIVSVFCLTTQSSADTSK